VVVQGYPRATGLFQRTDRPFSRLPDIMSRHEGSMALLAVENVLFGVNAEVTLPWLLVGLALVSTRKGLHLTNI
jgi:hypothetical protein